MHTLPRTKKSSQGEFSIDSIRDVVARTPKTWVFRLLSDALRIADAAEKTDLATFAVDCLVAPPRRFSRFLALRHAWTTWPWSLDDVAERTRLLTEVVSCWSRLDPRTRGMVRTLPSDAVRDALLAAIEKHPEAVADWVSSHHDEVSLDLARLILVHPDRDISKRAAMALVGRLTGMMHIADDPDFAPDFKQFECRGSLTPTDDSKVIVAIVDACEQFGEHQQREVMLAGLVLAQGPGYGHGAVLARLESMCRNPEHPGQSGIRAVLRRGLSPIVRERAWRWLGTEGLRVSALDRLGRATTLREHELVLKCGYLLASPKRRQALSALKVKSRRGVHGEEPIPGEALPTLVQREQLSPVSRRYLADFAESVQISPAARATLADAGLCDPHPWVRWAYLRRAEAREQLNFAFDVDERLARSAALMRSPAGVREWVRWPLRTSDQHRLRTTSALVRSQHPCVRAIARGDARRLNPFVSRSAESRLAARQWLKGNRQEFLGALARRIEHGNGHEQIEAILLTRTLKLVLTFEPTLIAMFESDRTEARVAATIVAALGDIDTPAAREVLIAGLAQLDPRVRANAVESLARVTHLQPQVLSQAAIAELKSDEHHRVRANALRCVIEQSTAGNTDARDSSGIDGLASLLSDDRPLHRLAGLWLAERSLSGCGRDRVGTSWDGLCRRVAAMASREDDEAVRNRATRCARRLLGEMRAVSRVQALAEHSSTMTGARP